MLRPSTRSKHRKVHSAHVCALWLSSANTIVWWGCGPLPSQRSGHLAAAMESQKDEELSNATKASPTTNTWPASMLTNQRLWTASPQGRKTGHRPQQKPTPIGPTCQARQEASAHRKSRTQIARNPPPLGGIGDRKPSGQARKEAAH